MMLMTKKSQSKNGTTLTRVIIKRAIIAAFAAMVIVVSLNALVPSTYTPQMNLENLGSPAGDEGFTLTPIDVGSGSRQTLLNDTPFLSEVQWERTDYALSEKYSSYRIMRTDDGALIEAEYGELVFSRAKCINIADQETLNVTIEGEIVSGQAQIGLGVSLWQWCSPSYYVGEWSESQEFMTGQRIELSLYVNLTKYSRVIPGWAIMANIEVRVEVPEQCIMSVNSVVAETTSEEALAPLVIDMQTTDGISIYGASSKTTMFNIPGVNITRQGTSEWSVLTPMAANQTLFLPPGSYECKVGIYNYSGEAVHFGISFDLASNRGHHLVVKISMITIVFSMEPNLPWVSVIIGWYDQVFHGLDDTMAPPFPNYIFICERTGRLVISIAYRGRIVGTGVSMYRTIQTNGSINLKVSVKAPFFSFFGVATTAGDIVLITIGIALLVSIVMSVNEITKPFGWRIIIKDPKFIPIVIFGVSSLLPWLIISQVSGGHAGRSYVELWYEYIPLNVELVRTQNSLWAFAISQYYVEDFLGKLLFFWFPLIYAYSRIGHKMDDIWNDYLFALAGPPVLALLALFSSNGARIGPGLILAIMVPILYVFQYKLYRRYGKGIYGR